MRHGLSTMPCSSAIPRPRLMKAALMLPERRQRLQQAQRVGACVARHHLRHQRHAHREFAADAQSGQEAVEGEILDVDRQRTQTGEQRVEQDRDHHGLGPADAIAEHAEEQPAARPARDEDGRDDVAGLPRRVRSVDAGRPGPGTRAFMAAGRASTNSC